MPFLTNFTRQKHYHGNVVDDDNDPLVTIKSQKV